MRTYKLAFGIIFSFIALVVLGQTNTPPVTELPDPKSIQGLLITLITLTVPLVVAVLKHFIEKLPGWSLPILATVLGALVTWVTQLAAGPQVTVWQGVFLGLAGVGLRELVDQVGRKLKDRGATVLILLSAVLLQGCQSPEITRALVSGTVSTGVQIGVRKNPSAVPYLKAATPIVCSAASGTNLSPAEITQKINEANLDELRTEVGVLLLNNALAVYTGLYNQYGTNVAKRPQLQAWLGGTCDGLSIGLASAGTNAARIPQVR